MRRKWVFSEVGLLENNESTCILVSIQYEVTGNVNEITCVRYKSRLGTYTFVSVVITSNYARFLSIL